MAKVHFLNVLEGDCNIIQHDSGRTTVIDVSNAYNGYDTPEEIAKKNSWDRKNMLARTSVPSNKKDYGQKKNPDNPITYLRDSNINSVFRFIITHPDMDHLDGIKDFFEEFTPNCFWDTNNDKFIDLNTPFAGYNKEDWKFYKQLRDGNSADRRGFYSQNEYSYYSDDNIKILCPTPELVRNGNITKDYNDTSYVLLFTAPKQGGGYWKLLFAGDSHDDSWNYILKQYKTVVSNVDVLFAPHHGRDSDRDYTFLGTLKPKLTLMGNASSKHLAYNRYPGPPSSIRITNNQAGYVILDINESRLAVYVKNYEFARDFRNTRNWSQPTYDSINKAYFLFQYNA